MYGKARVGRQVPCLDADECCCQIRKVGEEMEWHRSIEHKSSNVAHAQKHASDLMIRSIVDEQKSIRKHFGKTFKEKVKK